MGLSSPSEIGINPMEQRPKVRDSHMLSMQRAPRPVLVFHIKMISGRKTEKEFSS